MCLRVRGLSPLAVAASRDNDEVVRFLLANWQQDGETTREPELCYVLFLVSQGIDVFVCLVFVDG